MTPLHLAASITSWSHLKPKNSNSVGSSRCFDTHGHPGGGQLVEWKKIGSIGPQCGIYPHHFQRLAILRAMELGVSNFHVNSFFFSCKKQVNKWLS